MSSDCSNTAKSNGIPSSNELVDSLIEDFKSSCDVNPNESSKNDDAPPEDASKNDFVDDFFKGTKEEAKEEKHKAADYIDEEELKDKEIGYGEEDFSRLKSEADLLKIKGNEQFKNKEFVESCNTYTLGLRTCPLRYPKDRAILYANRAASKIKLELSQSAIEDCNKAIELEPSYIKALLRRAQLYESLDKLDEALEDYKKIVEYDSSHRDAMEACVRLPPLINEKNEKLKTEMLGKLKDLGNMVLRPFGLSTNNFQMVQDPNTGGYSISFKQN